MLSSQMFLVKLGLSLWLEETNRRKTQETQPPFPVSARQARGLCEEG